MKRIYIGLDIGSTTIKAIVRGDDGNVVHSKYERHSARIREKVLEFLKEIAQLTQAERAHFTITGSIGMGIAEQYGVAFIQEVVSATQYMRRQYPQVTTLIDIGGEDAKVVFFREGQAPDLRMNGNCAGGTGAFIDQMAILLGVSIEELNELALRAERVYPIASRCGVFCKTDIQNLLAKNATLPDIAASIFHAVAVQTVTTLSHGQDIGGPLLFCGGPLTFIPALRKAFADYLGLAQGDIIVPDVSQFIPAYGASIMSEKRNDEGTDLDELIHRIETQNNATYTGSQQLSPLFANADQHREWQGEKLRHRMPTAELSAGEHDVTIGIDSGSTTTKIVVLTTDGRLLFSFYASNSGNPIGTVRRGLGQLQNRCNEAGATLRIVGTCSTGYGEELIKAAFGFNSGIIETIAHYLAARQIVPDVSFILDIGGQDMKAIFVENGVINHIEINEACSSGCGTFIETFARSMNYDVEAFAREACLGEKPCDLGTRCTVFMNSKVKQVLREGATIGDIASGLSYSVVNNCLHKVLKIKRTEELGKRIVVQGGTMHNDSVVRALEVLTGCNVFRSDKPELMGAYGCALYARTHPGANLTLEEMLRHAEYETRQQQCHGCENNCIVNRYRFQNGNVYYSGNKCERVFTNRGHADYRGRNLYEEKLHLLFDRATANETAMVDEKAGTELPTIGIPRVLGMFEEFPFWHTLFTQCGFHVALSDASTHELYERGVKYVMSDNICFPAKLVHGHILNLQSKGVSRIFFPYVVYERQQQGQNSYNCPIVSGYSDVVRSSMNLAVPVDSPTITFKDPAALRKQLVSYLKTLGITRRQALKAITAAIEAQNDYEQRIAAANQEAYDASRAADRLSILLAGRPYHSDALVQHRMADIVTSLGVDCLTTDIVRGKEIDISDVHYVSQWAYPEHILKAAKWTAGEDAGVQLVELTSFGCGPDAFMLDEVHGLLRRHGKALTLLKIDDVSNVGSLTLRLRSIVDSLKINQQEKRAEHVHIDYKPFVTTPIYTDETRIGHQKIIVPYFTTYIAPLVSSFMRFAGYDVDLLPISDTTSDELGLRHANNEICYPATLIVGDIIKAFECGRYNPDTTTALITQTGGQCRASNYISLIKKALVEAGYPQVPVVSLSMSKNILNNQPAFRLPWRRLIPVALNTIFYSDAIAKLYHAAAPREITAGCALRLRDMYLEKAKGPVESGNTDVLVRLLREAADAFDKIVVEKACPRVGIVGEIYLKFNPYAQRGLTQWLVDHHIEVEPPTLCNFFLQSFVNQDVKRKTLIEQSRLPRFVLDAFYHLVRRKINAYNKAGSAFRYFRPFDDIKQISKNAEQIVSLSAQFGEGWLLPGEVATMVQHGINHVVSLQPFGCIANHIIAKGVEKRLRTLFPQLNYLSLDFDGGVSEVNVTNRLLLFANDLLQPQE